jgi:phage baseplate assembly protein W
MATDPISDLNTYFTTGYKSKVDVVEGIDAINNHLLNLINTTPATILFEPSYGSYIQHQLFEPLDENTAFEIKVWLRDAVTRWLPFISVDAGQTSIIPNEAIQGYNCTIVYDIVGTDQQGLLRTDLVKG